MCLKWHLCWAPHLKFPSVAKGISSLVAEAGKYGDALKSGNEAYAQFKTLGLDAAQIPQYIEVTNQFLKKQGGTDIAALFSKGLDALM